MPSRTDFIRAQYLHEFYCTLNELINESAPQRPSEVQVRTLKSQFEEEREQYSKPVVLWLRKAICSKTK